MRHHKFLFEAGGGGGGEYGAPGDRIGLPLITVYNNGKYVMSIIKNNNNNKSKNNTHNIIFVINH